MSQVNLCIIKHNVLSWKKNKNNLVNTYNKINPDVILINSHGNLNNEKIKIFNYIVYQTNKANERNNGSAIAERHDIKHRIREKFYSDIISIEIYTNLGIVEIATSYVPQD